jgi:FSR family fosmidomycin resistance protein-like MFS transporter
MSSAGKTLVALGLAHALLECFSGVWPIYKHLAGLDLRTAGLILAITGFTSSILQPVFGHWADRGDARKIVLLGTGLTFLMMFFGPVGAQMPVLGPVAVYALLALLMMVARLGHSMFHPAGAILAARALDGRHTSGLGVFVAFGWIGYGFSQAAFSAAYLYCNQHTEVLIIPGAVLLGAIALWCKPAPPPEHAQNNHSLRHKTREIWSMRREVGTLFCLMCMISITNAALYFLFPELVELKGHAGWVLNGGAQGFMLAGTALGVVLSGYCADRYGERQTLIVSMLLNIAAYQAFLVLPIMGSAAFVAVCFAAGVLTGAGTTLPIALGQKMFPRHASTISGVMMGWTWAIGNLAPLLTAELVRPLGIVNALTIMGSANVIGFFCALNLKPAAEARPTLLTPEIPPVVTAVEAISAK